MVLVLYTMKMAVDIRVDGKMVSGIMPIERRR
jgi:hypothetical protein